MKTQPRRVVTRVLVIMGVGALGIMAFGFIVSLRFRLNRETHAVLMNEIERFKRGPTRSRQQRIARSSKISRAGNTKSSGAANQGKSPATKAGAACGACRGAAPRWTVPPAYTARPANRPGEPVKREMGWTMGLEPTTAEITTRGSTN